MPLKNFLSFNLFIIKISKYKIRKINLKVQFDPFINDWKCEFDGQLNNDKYLCRNIAHL